jgi:hypothetical protein
MMNKRERLAKHHSEEVQEILSEYRKAVNVMNSVKYIDQLEAACKYCSSIITKHFYKNSGNKLDNPAYKAKMIFAGKMGYINRIIAILNTISAELDAKAQQLSEELTERPKQIGYHDDTLAKKMGNIRSEVKEWVKKRDEDCNKQNINYVLPRF